MLELFVDSIKGNDLNDGTTLNPVKTLAKAKELVKIYKNKVLDDNRPQGTDISLQRDIYVKIRGGIYNLTETLEIGKDDGGSLDQKIVYTAEDKTNIPIINSDIKIEGWKESENVTNININSGKIWVADIPEILIGKRINSLYNGDRTIRRSFKNFKSQTKHRNDDAFAKEYRQHLSVPDDIIDVLANEQTNLEDFEIGIYPRQRWMHAILRIKGIIKNVSRM